VSTSTYYLVFQGKEKKMFGCRPAVGTVATLNSRTLRAASPGTHGPYLVFNLGGVMSRYGEKIWGTRPGYSPVDCAAFSALGF